MIRWVRVALLCSLAALNGFARGETIKIGVLAPLGGMGVEGGFINYAFPAPQPFL